MFRKIKYFFFMASFLFLGTGFCKDVWKAYVTCDLGGGIHAGVIPIDIDTQLPETPIPLNLNAAYGSVVVSADGLMAYVACFSAVVPIDLLSGEAFSPIVIPSMGNGIAITPDGNWVYVTCYNSGKLIQINTATRSVTQTLDLSTPMGIAITPDGKKAYVSQQLMNNVVVLDIENPTDPILSLATVTAGGWPLDLAVTPDGTRVYVANYLSHSITRIDNTEGYVTTTISLDVSLNPTKIAITPDGSTAYVVAGKNGYLIPIPLATETPSDGVLIGGVDGIAITPDGVMAYLSQSTQNRVVAFKFSTEEIQYINTGLSPSGVAITPDQAPTASFTTNLAIAGAPSLFDASVSSSPVGDIVTYDWDFGDGDTFSTTSPITTHTFFLSGTYTVTLIVTNAGGTSLEKTFTGQIMSNNGGPSAETSQQIQIDFPPNPPAKPPKFSGKIYQRSHKYRYSLHTRWNLCPSPGIVRYEIYAPHHHLIASIDNTSPPKKNINFFAHFLKPSEMTHRFLHYLKEKYKIRAVNEFGLKSHFQHLKLKKRS